MTTPTLHMHTCTTGRTQHALGSEGKRLLVHCHEGKPTYGDQCRLFGVFARDLAEIIMVLSTTMCYARDTRLLAGSLC